jgi:hypothetical protein
VKRKRRRKIKLKRKKKGWGYRHKLKNNIKVMIPKSCCNILYEAYLDEICHIYNFSTAINFKGIFIKKN